VIRVRWPWALLFGVGLVPGLVAAQSLRGRVLDQTRHPLIGALIEVRDSAGRPLPTTVTAASGGFMVPLPGPGSYRYRVAAIGFVPRPFETVRIPADGLVLADLVLQTMTMRLPDLIAVGGNRHCGKSGVSDDIFSRVLESAHTALDVMEATIRSHQVSFEVARINTRTQYGILTNFEVADTTLQTMSRWPIQSIEPDTLRLLGFGRLLAPGDENTREYYGPDARVLFSDWFLETHCFKIDRPDRRHPSDSLHLRFAPARKSKIIDISGDLVLDPHNLSLLQFTFTHTNLPNWMPDGSAGGEMQFTRLKSGLWIARTWAIWAPAPAFGFDSRRYLVAGDVETHGWVLRVMGPDSTVTVLDN
jgi:hypothetical protein